MSYRLLTDSEFQQVKGAVLQQAERDAREGRWSGFPNENESEMGAFQALRSVIPYLNVVTTSQQLRELGELYAEAYTASQRSSPISPGAAGKRRRRKTKRTRLQRKM